MKRNPESGMILLVEILISTVLFMILAAMSTPYVIGLQRVSNQVSAHRKISAVAAAENTVALCSIPANNCSAAPVQAVIPANGSLNTEGYTYTMTNAGTSNWTFTASPVNNGTGIYNYFVDASLVVRCAQNAPATATSPACN
jgi:hypothetical protein